MKRWRWRALTAAVLAAAVSGGATPAVRADGPTFEKPRQVESKPATAATTKPVTAVAPTTRPAAATMPTTAVRRIPAAPQVASAPALPPAFDKANPETAADLKALQEQVKTIVAKVGPTVVGLRVGGGQGSGVIISDDGYVMTAGHVNGAPGRDVVILLQDGKSVKAKSLGVNYAIDSGLVKIDAPGPLPGGKWPFAPLAKSADLKRGQWAIALGHPGGYRQSRPAPLRLGKVSVVTPTVLRTDCTLVGGDSGGPLFDLQGRVIGIHSRIGQGLADNMHVPADTYRDTWEQLAKGESWGLPAFARTNVYLGVQLDQAAPDCKIGEVFPEGPAAKAGVKPGDVITKFDGQRVANYGELLLKLGKKKPGDEAAIEVQRGIESVKLKAMLTKRPEAR
ncbi:MAG TPA: trypsin-like peptidase domain-containing protein [Tepidisphaeraceae bacterium]|nr:trypsin-like peptidase domain-containing protein [Tepidisphaeraceae bacterium]